MKQTPIQEAISHLTSNWSAPGDLWKPDKIIEYLETLLPKEKEFAKECFNAGIDLGYYPYGINMSAFDDFIKQYNQ